MFGSSQGPLRAAFTASMAVVIALEAPSQASRRTPYWSDRGVSSCEKRVGADEENRTPDTKLGKLLLYH